MNDAQFADVINTAKKLYDQWKWSDLIQSIWFEKLISFDFNMTMKELRAVYSVGSVRYLRDLLPKIINGVRSQIAEQNKFRNPTPNEAVKIYTLIQVEAGPRGRRRRSPFYAKFIPEDLDAIERDAVRSRERAERLYGGRWAIQRDWELILGSEAEELQTSLPSTATSENAESQRASSPPASPLFEDAGDDIPF